MRIQRVGASSGTGVGAVVTATVALVVLIALGPGPAAAAAGASWAKRADAVCAPAVERLWEPRRAIPADLRATVGSLTPDARAALASALAVYGEQFTDVARRLAAIEARPADRALVAELVDGIAGVGDTATASAARVRDPAATATTVAELVPPTEAFAVAIDAGGLLGADECAAMPFFFRVPNVSGQLPAASPARLEAIATGEVPEGYELSGSESGPISITDAAEMIGGPCRAPRCPAVDELGYLNYTGGHLGIFEPSGLSSRPGRAYATVRLFEFGDPAGAAENLHAALSGNRRAAYRVSGLPGAWGYADDNPGGDVSRFVVFRQGGWALVVGITGAPAYSKAEVLAFARQVADRAAATPTG